MLFVGLHSLQLALLQVAVLPNFLLRSVDTLGLVTGEIGSR